MATAYKNPFDDAPSKPTQTKPKSKSKKTEAKPKELKEKQKHYKAQTEQLLNLPKEQMDKLINAYQKAVSDMEKAKENYSKLRRTLLRINREGGNALGNDLNVKFVEYESVTFPRSVVEKALGKDEAYKIAKKGKNYRLLIRENQEIAETPKEEPIGEILDFPTPLFGEEEETEDGAIQTKFNLF